MSFVWIQWTNKFNDSISVNVKFGKSIYSFNDFIVGKRTAICYRSTLFFERVIKRLASTKKSITNSLFNRRGGISGIFEALTNAIKIVGNKIIEHI